MIHRLQQKERYDVIIIGGGPSGLQAAIYTTRAKLKTLVLWTSSKKSVLNRIPYIGNYLGFPNGLNGEELISFGIAHVEKYGGFVQDEEVIVAEPMEENEDDYMYCVKTPKQKYCTKTIIIATGLGILRAGIKGEANFENKGLSYCVICDGYFFQHKKVAVIGNKNFAAEKVIELFSYTKNITLFTQGQKPDIAQKLLNTLKDKNIIPRQDKIVEIVGKEKVEAVTFENGEQENFDGIFIGVGTASSLSFAKSLGVETSGNFLNVKGPLGETNVKGIFAAGDCVGAPLQISKAVGEGAEAGLGVIKYIQGGVHVDHEHS